MYIKHELYTKNIMDIVEMKFAWEKLSNQSILITGATGMIGTALIDVLMERNKEHQSGIVIYAMSRSEERAKERFSDYWGASEFHFLQGDINEPLESEITFDYIFHCASNTHPRAYSTDPVGTVLTNIVGTNNLLSYAVKHPAKRIVFLSTVEIYGENRGDIDRFDENYCGYIDCNTMRAGYPEGKRAGEALCQSYISQYGMDIVIPRICRVYGPTMLESDSKALAQFIRNAVNKENIVLKSEGTQLFSYGYVTDVVEALLTILDKGECGQAYNIADEASDIRLRDLAAILAQTAGKEVIFELPDAVEAKGYSKATKAIMNADKLKGLGWRATHSIEEGLTKTVRILQEM